MQAISRSIRRGKNNISKVLLPLYKVSPFDSEIDLPKRKLFTEYYHNDEKFEILFLNNPESMTGHDHAFHAN